jgi:hypothetical protein
MFDDEHGDKNKAVKDYLTENVFEKNNIYSKIDYAHHPKK